MTASLGRYELLGLLGRGGMAEVYLARRRSGSVEKRLVVKRMRRDRAGDARALELLIREARLSMSLAHQNVVTVFDFGRVDDDVFLAMEHVEGRDLGSTLARPGASPMAPVCAAHVAVQCCLALDHAHRRLDGDGRPLGLVHRDVTPRNVLVSEAGEVKLADFGVAGQAGDPAGGVRGTAAYMAPEQARGEDVDARADLYGLGLVLWELLAGRRARSATTVEAALAAARAGEPPPPLDERVPAALVRVIARATAADREQRYPSARAMLADLDAYLVEARAVEAGPALPDQLAAWFARAWAGAPPALAPLPDGVLASLSEGATVRSLAVTAGDSAERGDDAEALIDPAAVDPPTAPTTAADDAPAPIVAPPRRRRTIALGAILVAAGAIGGVLATRGDRGAAATALIPAQPGAPAPAAAGPSAEPTVAPTPVEPPARAGAPPAHAVERPPGAPSPGPSSARRPHAAATEPAVATPAPAAPATRAVTIGARPWADFTIDDDPAVHQTPETVPLAPGPHRIHFRNPRLGLSRDVTLDVPADRDLRHVEQLE